MSSQNVAIKLITAVGSGPAFAVHKDKALATLALLPKDSCRQVLVCAPSLQNHLAVWQLCTTAANQSVDAGWGAGFRAGKCAPYPATVNIEQRNPTCDIRHYRGDSGRATTWSLLDAEQEIPWPISHWYFTTSTVSGSSLSKKVTTRQSTTVEVHSC